MINPLDQFMELSYHIFIMATQSTDAEATRPIQYGTTLVLVALTFLLNLAAIVTRNRFRAARRELRAWHDESRAAPDAAVPSAAAQGRIRDLDYFYGPKQALHGIDDRISRSSTSPRSSARRAAASRR